jgi:GNAT superfamily N-acetyltransferase
LLVAGQGCASRFQAIFNRMQIRAAQPSDAKEVDRLFQEFVNYLRAIGDPTEYRFSSQQYLEDGFGPDPGFRGLVAEHDAGLIAYALFCKAYDGDYRRCLDLIDLYVQEDYRGQGIGQLLIDRLGEIARTEGCSRIAWVVNKQNAGAIRFYERLGAGYSDDCHFMYLDLQ